MSFLVMIEKLRRASVYLEEIEAEAAHGVTTNHDYIDMLKGCISELISGVVAALEGREEEEV